MAGLIPATYVVRRPNRAQDFCILSNSNCHNALRSDGPESGGDCGSTPPKTALPATRSCGSRFPGAIPFPCANPIFSSPCRAIFDISIDSHSPPIPPRTLRPVVTAVPKIAPVPSQNNVRHPEILGVEASGGHTFPGADSIVSSLCGAISGRLAFGFSTAIPASRRHDRPAHEPGRPALGGSPFPGVNLAFSIACGAICIPNSQAVRLLSCPRKRASKDDGLVRRERSRLRTDACGGDRCWMGAQSSGDLGSLGSCVPCDRRAGQAERERVCALDPGEGPPQVRLSNSASSHGPRPKWPGL